MSLLILCNLASFDIKTILINISDWFTDSSLPSTTTDFICFEMSHFAITRKEKNFTVDTSVNFVLRKNLTRIWTHQKFYSTYLYFYS